MLRRWLYVQDSLHVVATYLSLIKANWPLAQELLMNLDGPCNMLLFCLGVNILIIHPAVSVRGNFPITFLECSADGWVAFERHAHGKDSGWNLFLFKQPMKAPKANAASVIVQALHVGVTLSFCGSFRS